MKIEIGQDDCMSREPWAEYDGTGIISEWTRRVKLPGERLIHSDRGSFRYYDWQRTMAMAKAEGWNAPPYDQGTKGEKAHRAVEADFQRWRAYFNDQWTYVYVAILDDDGNVIDSMGGVESDYAKETAAEMLDSVLAELKTQILESIE